MIPIESKRKAMKEIIAKTYHEAEEFLSEIPKFTKKNPFEETKGFYTFKTVVMADIVKRI